jgi:hypothetical protein
VDGGLVGVGDGGHRTIVQDFSRLRRVGFTDARLTEWAITAIVSRLTRAEAHMRVSLHLAEAEQGQASLLDILEEGQEEQNRRSSRKRTVLRHTVHALSSEEAYLQIVLRMLEQGLLGQEESPFAIGSPRTHARKISHILLCIAEHVLTVRGKVPKDLLDMLTKMETILVD